VVAPDFALAKTLLQMNQLRAEKAATSSLVMSVVKPLQSPRDSGELLPAAICQISRDDFCSAHCECPRSRWVS
jgi:hypothetical protein